MVNIVVCGWYGNGNLGDEVILESILSQLRLNFKNPSITVFSDNPRQTSKNYKVRSVRRQGNLLHWLRRLFAIYRADLFMLGGGGILMDYGKSDSTIPRWLEGMRLAQRLHVPDMAFSIGVGKIWTEKGKSSIQKILSKAAAICVRDEDSLVALSNLGCKNVETTADIALLHPSLSRAGGERSFEEKGTLSVLVCLRHWYENIDSIVDQKVFEGLKSGIAEFLSDLIDSRNAVVSFVPLRTERSDDDREVAAQVLEHMRNKKSARLFTQTPSSSEFISLLEHSNILVAMRLHALILAVRLKVPAIAIDYAPKVGSFMHSIGADRWVLSPGEAKPEKLREVASKLLESQFPIQVNALLKQSEDLSQRNVEIAKDLVRISHRRLASLRRLPVLLGLSFQGILQHLLSSVSS